MTRNESQHECDDRCGPSGCACFCFRDAWTPGSIYRPNEAVPYDGSSYVATHANQNDPPPSPNWALIAGKGDAGPQGPAGPAGPAGPPGATGLSDETIAYPSYSGNAINVGTNGQDITSLTLPPGSYVIMGTVNLFNNDGDTQNWTLQLLQDGQTLLSIQGSEGGNGQGILIGDDNTHGTGVPILTTINTDAPTTVITLRGYGYNIWVFPSAGRLVALKVGKIYGS
jgi:hypothetical protein